MLGRARGWTLSITTIIGEVLSRGCEEFGRCARREGATGKQWASVRVLRLSYLPSWLLLQLCTDPALLAV